jgi:flagella basal body P-ring formation protein FlgA
MVGFSVGFSVAAFICATLSAFLAAWALMEVFAYKRSTHNVQFVTADDVKREEADDKAFNAEVHEVLGKSMRRAFNEGDEE